MSQLFWYSTFLPWLLIVTTSVFLDLLITKYNYRNIMRLVYLYTSDSLLTFCCIFVYAQSIKNSATDPCRTATRTQRCQY